MENYDIIKEKIINLINNPDIKISFKSCIIIYGKPGIGKTYTIDKICSELELKVIKFTLNNCPTSDNFEDLLYKNITIKNNFLELVSNKIEKKIIIIDNYEILLSVDRTINNIFYNILNNKKFKNISIVCICSNDLLKKIGNIKKKCSIYEFKTPSLEYIYEILKKKYNDIKEKELKEIIKKSHNNIEQCFFLIENRNNMKLNKIDCIDKTLSIEYLYGNDYNRENVSKILYSESWLIPLRFHENLVIELKNRKTTMIQKNKLYKDFIYDMCLYDLLMNNNCINSGIDIICSYVAFLSELGKRKEYESKLDNFTKLLSYLSLQKKYVKKSYLFNENFFQIGNYHINSLNINLYS